MSVPPKSRSRLIHPILIALLACGLASLTARADIPRPRPTPPNPAPVKPVEQQLVISTDANAKQAHLRIPASALRPGAQSNAGPSQMRTVLAGIALTGAITISGLLLVRGRGVRGRVVLAGLIVGAGVVTTIATANVPPPRRPDPTRVVIPAGGLKMPIVVEIVNDGANDGAIHLTLPAEAPR